MGIEHMDDLDLSKFKTWLNPKVMPVMV